MDVLQMDGMYNISLLGGQARAIPVSYTHLSAPEGVSSKS